MSKTNRQTYTLQEGATKQLDTLVEAGPADGTRVKPIGTDSTKREVTIIEAGWGSSGYYPKAVLARDGATAFPKGTHMYMNHPTMTEDVEIPERKVEALAAVLTADPVMKGNALVAEAEVFQHWTPVVNAVADAIGTSIRAMGEHVHGEAEGKEGSIITALTEGLSVDFVTLPGAKGKVGPLIESAQARVHPPASALEEARNAANWLEARIHSDFTDTADYLFGQGYVTREERVALSSAIGDALEAFNSSVSSNLPQLLERDPYDDPEDTGETQVQETGRSGGDPTQEEAIVADDTKQLSELQESVDTLKKTVEELTESAKTEKEGRERAEDALVAERARNIVNEALVAEAEEGEDALPELPDRALARVKESVLGGKVPLDEDGKVDKERLVQKLHKGLREEAEYLGEGSDKGRVTGMGASPRETEVNETKGGTTTPTEATEAEGALKESLGRLGMSDKAATVAAKGR
jgi:hypothetical protein